MHHPTCAHNDTGVTGRGLFSLIGGCTGIAVAGLKERARELQEHGMQQKLNGDHHGAVLTYRALLQVVRALDDLHAFSLPQGLSSQLVERAIELEEDVLTSAALEKVND